MFRFLTAGESHGPCLIMVVEGLPAGLAVDKVGIDADLRRRQGGYGRGGRMKIERDARKGIAPTNLRRAAKTETETLELQPTGTK